jgi:hypothetical protein
MQSNQDIVKMSKDNSFNIIDNEIWESLTNKLLKREKIDVLNRNIQLEIDSQNTSKENLEKYLTERRALTQKYEKLQGK